MKNKVELHTHTGFSHDSIVSLDKVVRACLKKQINCIAVTDHNQIEGAIRLQKMAPFKVIVGEEILTKEGEIIGLFLKKRISAGLSMKATINRIRNQGGIVYLPHPYDKTTRPQILKQEDNPKYYKIIKHFEKLTSIGAVLNTSFNIHGEPIVCIPRDALSTFKRSGLRHLAMENYLISKS